MMNHRSTSPSTWRWLLLTCIMIATIQAFLPSIQSASRPVVQLSRPIASSVAFGSTISTTIQLAAAPKGKGGGSKGGPKAGGGGNKSNKGGGKAGGRGPAKTPRLRTIEEVGKSSLEFGRADFPPTPDTQFPASVDYLFTVAVLLGGETEFVFTLDSTASVNLVKREVADELERLASAGTKMGGGGRKGFGAAKPPSPSKKNYDNEDREMQGPEEIVLDMVLPAEPKVRVLNRAVVSDDWGGVGAGCLGLPFLRSFGMIDIDLKSMEGQVESPKPSMLSGVDDMAGDDIGLKEWTVDFAPLTINVEDDEEIDRGASKQAAAGELPEVWIVDVHLDNSEEGIPAIVDLGCQSSILNWRAAKALGYRIKGMKPSVTPETGLPGEQEGNTRGEGGRAPPRLEVFFADETRLNLADKVVIPSRRLAIADLPVFEYAGLQETPAMVLGLDVLGSGDRLILDWAKRRLTLVGPLLPPKLNRASLEVPLIKYESTRLNGVVPPFGLPRQYGVPVLLGPNELEAVFMIDTAAGGTVITRDTWDAYSRSLSKEDKRKAEESKEGVDMAGTGGGKTSVLKVTLDMLIGGTEHREGYEVEAEAAVVDGLTTEFDGILGQNFFEDYDVVDFDFRHSMLRFYEFEDEEGGGKAEKEIKLEEVLDHWPLPSSTPLPVPLIQADASKEEAQPFLAVNVILDGREDVKILGILDTGGQTSVLNWAAAKALGLTEEGGRVQTSDLNAYGVDRKPIPLRYAGFGDIRLVGGKGGGEGGEPLRLMGRNLAIADLPGLAQLNLLDSPAMIVGMDLLDGDQSGRLILDIRNSQLYIAQ